MAVRTLILGLAVVGALVLSMDTRLGAASRITEDFGDLVKRAAIVVEIEVIGSRNENNAQVGLPLTVSSSRVVRTLRGDASGMLEIERFGGLNGPETLVVPGQAQLTPGDRAVLLLIPSPLENGRWRVLGGDAGCILSETAADGEMLLKRATGSFSYYVADPASLSGFVAHNAAALRPTQFNALLTALLETGRPVLSAAATTPVSPVAPAAAEMPVVSLHTPPAPADVPLFFKVGVFLLCVTLAFCVMRVARPKTVNVRKQ